MKLEGIDILIKRTDREKTLSIFIERDGTVKVLAPKKATKEKIESIIISKQASIFSKLAKWKELNYGLVKRKFVNGQSFLYLGRNYRLNITKNQEEPLKIRRGMFCLDRMYLKEAEKHFKNFYKAKGLEKIEERLKLIETKFNKRPTSIKVLELKNRWASWTPNNTLNFHWKCAMAPVSVLDYIITHEMVHLKYPNHSKEFWNELDKKMPNYREQEEWLKRNGVKMGL
ncbi:MAG: SprT family zinc-dependent metalloprotease [Ignavibacteria bacterium]|nr:SprT family zinc-dependent metalloprotease [Ignavibacteria bacterium]